MPASNIEAVALAAGGVSIRGKLTDMKDHNVELLHVWLAQPGLPSGNGAGLAIDCLNKVVPTTKPGEAAFALTTTPADATARAATATAPAVNPGVVGTF